MARAGISYFDVTKAAERIVGNGRAPTIELIRNILGTGSNSTIGTHLRAWRVQQDPTQQLAMQANLPEELVALMKGLWERVTLEAQSQIDTIKGDAQNELTQLKAKIQHLQQENARWQQQNQHDIQEKDGLCQKSTTLEQIISNYKSEIAALQPKLDGLTQQLQERQSRIEELNLQNRQLQANLEHYREASVEQRQRDEQRFEHQQRELEQIIQQLKVELTKHSQEKISLRQANEQLCFEKTSLQAEVAKFTASNERLLTKLSETSAALAQQTSTQQHWQTQYAILSPQRDEQHKKNIELEVNQAVLLEKIATISEELKAVKAKNKVIAQEKLTLGQENWVLAQEKTKLLQQLGSALKA